MGADLAQIIVRRINYTFSPIPLNSFEYCSTFIKVNTKLT